MSITMPSSLTTKKGLADNPKGREGKGGSFMFLPGEYDYANVRVNGRKVRNVETVTPPGQVPYWRITLAGGSQILATGNVDMEVRPKARPTVDKREGRMIRHIKVKKPGRMLRSVDKSS
jgi:hypothetical protein